MKRNISKKGRFSRFLIAILFFFLIYINNFSDAVINVVFISVIVSMLVSALTNFCPLFHFLDYDQNIKIKKKFKY